MLEVYKNDYALLAHLTNLIVGVYLEAHSELGTDFSIEFYGTVWDKVVKAMNGRGIPHKIFKQNLDKADFNDESINSLVRLNY